MTRKAGLQFIILLCSIRKIRPKVLNEWKKNSAGAKKISFRYELFAEKSVQIIWSSGGGRGGRGRKRRGKGQGSKGQLKSSLCTCSWHRGTCAQGFVNICFLLPRLLSLLNPCFPPCHVYSSTPPLPPTGSGPREKTGG